MAFKLRGDQHTGIHLIQRRRVEELLSNNIPEEEALLTRSGRYACLVCKHRPVFDTVAMLSLHRAGQKHLKAAHLVLRWKELDRAELEKREQLKQLEKGSEPPVHESTAEDAAPLLVKTQAAARHALLKAAPYCPLAKKAAPTSTEGEKSGLFFTRKRKRGKDGGDTGSSTKKPHHPSDSKATEVANSSIRATGSVVAPSEGTETPTQVSERGKLSIRTSRYLQLKSSGWLRGPDGSWIKDPNVEFDSDEEEPQ